jgi:hypothetical protein
MDIARYREDLKTLIGRGENLQRSMAIKIDPALKETFGKGEIDWKTVPDFHDHYQQWYSEAHRLISQLLPDRRSDFEALYRPQGNKKTLTNENYTILDYLKSLIVEDSFKKEIVGLQAAWELFNQQLNIVRSIEGRFESSLYDIRTLVQADLFLDELEAAAALNGKGFMRGAGAMAGVVLEGHLRAICEQHCTNAPKSANLGRLNEHMRENGIIDLPTWRFIQHLTDIRNLCDHKLEREPTCDQVSELIAGVKK